jgi:colicin import membrane protein
MINMTGLCLATALALLASGVQAQEDTTTTTHQSIATVRQQKMAEFDAQEAQCQSRFAVTDCQNAVAVRRRQMLSELKNQEVQLDDVQRRQKGAQQLLRSQEKLDDWERQRPADARPKSPEDKRHPLSPVSPKLSTAKVPAGLDASTMAQNRAAYQEKQSALVQRRLERDKRIKEQAGHRATALPVAP